MILHYSGQEMGGLRGEGHDGEDHRRGDADVRQDRVHQRVVRRVDAPWKKVGQAADQGKAALGSEVCAEDPQRLPVLTAIC